MPALSRFLLAIIATTVAVEITISPIDGIQRALSGSSTTVILAPGIYSGFRNCDLVINGTNALSLVGKEGAGNTVIDCTSVGTRCLKILRSNAVRISGITFKGGVAPGTFFDDFRSNSPSSENKAEKVCSFPFSVFNFPSFFLGGGRERRRETRQ